MKAPKATGHKPRQRDRSATEEDLIAAASGEFAKEGYENATTRGIADRAGCSEALIQRYFNGKEGLLLAVLKKEDADSHRLSMVDRPLCGSLLAEIREILNFGLANFARRSAKMRIVLSRVLLDPTFTSDFNRITIRSQVGAELKARLGRYVEAGMLDPTLDLGLLTESLMGTVFHLGFLHREILGTDEAEIKRMADTFAALFARGASVSPGVSKGGAKIRRPNNP